MEPITDALELWKRQAELEAGLRLAGGIRVTEEARALCGARQIGTLSAGHCGDPANGFESASTCGFPVRGGPAKFVVVAAIAIPEQVLRPRSAFAHNCLP
jgi:hypothetical protein